MTSPTSSAVIAPSTPPSTSAMAVEGPVEVEVNGAGAASDEAEPPLPLHLQNLPPERQRALRQRMRRELQLQEVQQQQPRRVLLRGLVASAVQVILTSVFLMLLIFRLRGSTRISWIVVFVPLELRFLVVVLKDCIEIKDHLRILRLAPHEEEVWSRQLLAKFEGSLWNVVCLITSALVAVHLHRHHGRLSDGDLGRWFVGVWVYGAVCLALSTFSFCKCCFCCVPDHEPCANMQCKDLVSSAVGWLGNVTMGLVMRVIPVLLIVDKIDGASYTWTVAFVPYWIGYGALALIGCCLCCCTPFFGAAALGAHDEQRALLCPWVFFVSMFSAVLLSSGVCSLVFLVLLSQYLSGNAQGRSLTTVLSPLFVMYGLLVALVVPLYSAFKRAQATQQAFQQLNDPGAEPTPVGEARKRPGVSRTLSEPAVLVRQTSTLFARQLTGVDLEAQHPEANPDGGAKPGGAAAEESREEEPCYVCMERKRDSVLQPCGHGGMCYPCALELVTAPQPSAPRCPLCRKDVHEVLKLSGTTRMVRQLQARESADAPGAEGNTQPLTLAALATQSWTVGGL